MTDVPRAAVRGLGAQPITDELFISTLTPRTRISRVMTKLGVSYRVALIDLSYKADIGL